MGRPRTPDEERAYGSEHRARRKALLDQLARIGAAPCGICGEPMSVGMVLHLDHSDPAMKQYGAPGDRLVHGRCNTASGGRLSQAIKRAMGTPRPGELPPPAPASRTDAEIEAGMLRNAPHHDGCRCRRQAQSRCW